MSTPNHRLLRALRRGALCMLAGPVLSGCSGGPPPGGAASPTLDAQQVAAAAALANRIPTTAQLNFEWTLREPNLNVSGEGVARVQPPDHARLDLFLGEGSSVLAVALVDDDLRTPRGAPRGVIPSAPLLWASFGIFRPGESSTLLGAEVDDDEVRLRYLLASGEELHYHLRGDRIVGVEMIIEGESIHQVRLDVPDPSAMASEAVYRNVPSFRELRVAVTSSEDRDTFPERIWSPGR